MVQHDMETVQDAEQVERESESKDACCERKVYNNITATKWSKCVSAPVRS